MDILQTAIEKEGGVGKLADSLGVGQNVVSNWRARRLPKSWAHVLRLKYQPELAPTPSNTAQTATENVAEQGVANA